jgi:hypothetical protein
MVDLFSEAAGGHKLFYTPVHDIETLVTAGSEPQI